MRNIIKLIIQEILLVVLALGAGSNAVAQQAAEQDPNLFFSNDAKQIIDDNVTLYWQNIPGQYGISTTSGFITSNPLVPYVVLYQQLPSRSDVREEICDYLGFVEGMGSLLIRSS